MVREASSVAIFNQFKVNLSLFSSWILEYELISIGSELKPHPSQLSQHALATEFHLPLNYHMVATNADRELDLRNKCTDAV